MNTRLAKRLRSSARGDRGFSLIEVTVSMVVVMVVFAALLAALLTGIASAKTEQDRAAANQLAADAVEGLRVVDWDKLGFYSTDFPTFPALHAGESVVQLTGPAPAAAARPADDAPLPTRTVTVNGLDYQVDTWVTWAGSSAATPNDGTTYAAKRLAVEVVWQTRSGERSLSTTGLRTPTVAEVPPPAGASGSTTSVSLTGASVTGNQTLSASSMLTAALAVAAETPAGADFVRLAWLQDGSETTVELVPDATRKFWSKPTGQLVAGSGPFAAGTTTFTFTAGRYTGETQTSTSNVVFTAAGGGTPFAITSSSVVSAIEPAAHVLDEAYKTTSVLTLTVQTNVVSTGVTAKYQVNGAEASKPLQSTNGGTTWTTTLPVGTGPMTSGSNVFQFVAAKTGASANSSAAVVLTSPTISAIAMATPTLCQGKNDKPGKASVNVKNVEAGDAVSFKVLRGSGTTTTAHWSKASGSGVSAGSAGFTFAASVPTSVSLNDEEKLEVSVSRAKDGASQVTVFTVTTAKPSSGNC